MTTRKLTTLSLLSALALIIFVVESQLPPLAPVPGIKMGLANIISLFAMFWMGRKEALAILIARIFLGSIFTGHAMTLLYSLSGGLLAFTVIAIFYRTFSLKALWIPSMISGICHNIGQVLCAIWVTGTIAIVAYLPVLIISGCVTGLFTGLIAQYLINHAAFFQRPFPPSH